MNHLANSTSPYLLQHARNPVEWYPWGAEALQLAKSTDKPIFLSIGYAACHWCHVMAHESFEDPGTATLMNELFVCIKVDREERPDLDGIYMAATTSLTGSGGWPMSVFLTPDLKPFYAGTYFPPVPRYNMPAFRDVLSSVAKAWKDERENVERISGQISAHLERETAWSAQGLPFTPELLANAAKYLHDSYDFGFGGWGQAPKFPQAQAIEFLLRRAARKPLPESGETLAKSPALHALRAMARGGMYDVVGGGFSRYSTDNLWRVPHFEKMLYDNALLARAYLHAWQLSGDPFFRRVAIETLDFVQRELTGPEGGFYASLDADSEGVEGKFYVWTLDEIRQALGEQADFFVAAYGITAQGNWEGRTVLQRALDDGALASRFPGELPVPDRIADCHARLLELRGKRVRPATDDKILAGWNGLMLAAFAEAARILNSSDFPAQDAGRSTRSYLEVATRNADFLLSALRPGGKLRRAWRADKASEEVFLEDYAAVLLGLLELYQTDFNPRWFAAAQELADELLTQFPDPRGGFFDTPSGAESLLLRPKDLQDNATPSGSSLAVEALLRLAAFSDRPDYRTAAEQAFAAVTEMAVRYPTSFAGWLCAAELALAPIRQVAIVGDPSKARVRELLAAVRGAYRPDLVVAAADVPAPPDSPALLADRPLINGKPAAYVCEGFVCKLPAGTVSALKKQLAIRP